MDAPESNSAQRHWARRVFLSRSFLIAAALLVIYTLVGFFLAPYLIKRQAARFVEESLQCRLTIEEVRVNPYALTLDIKNLDLRDKDGSPLFAFKESFINFQAASLWRWAWSFAEVRLDGPDMNLEMRPGGRINLLDIADRMPKKEQGQEPLQEGKKKDHPPRLIMEQIALNKGRFVFTDRSGTTPAGITLEPIGLELKNFTTLPERKGLHAFEGTLPHGGTIRWAGDFSLEPLWSEGQVALKSFKTETAWEFLQDVVLLEEPGGAVDLEARYRFAYDAKSPSMVIEGLKVTVSGLELKARGAQEPLLDLEAVHLRDGRLDLASHEVLIGELAVSRGRLEASVNEQGRLNWQDIVPDVSAESKSASSQEEASEGPAWRMGIKDIHLDDLSLAYADRSRAYPIDIAASSLGLKLQASLSTGAGKTQALAENLGVRFSGVSFKEAGHEEPLVLLDALSLEGGRLDLEARELWLERVMLQGGRIRAEIEKSGSVNLVRMLGSGDAGKIQKEIAETGQEARAEGRPWTVSAGAVGASGLSIAFKDQTLSPAPAVTLEGITFELADMTSDGSKAMPFHASMSVKEGGGLEAKGLVAQGMKSAEASLLVSSLALKPFQPYVAKVAFLNLEGGSFSLAGQATYREGKEGRNMQFSGNADIAKLLVSESDTKERFLSWDALKVQGIQLGLGPDRLEIAEVRLSEPYGKLIIYEDQSVNLKKALRPQEPGFQDAQRASQGEATGGMPVNVRRIQIERGHLDFADLGLRPQFGARIDELKGTIVGLSTKEGERAEVQLEGRVDDYGMSKIQGQLEPFNAKRFTDISMIFRNVEMTTLTPYSGKFAGYKIDSGKLSLDLRYLIQESELKGNNQIILDKLTLGEKVDSPDAPNLPLELALALLKDSNDRIDIGLPVSGNLEDPQFSYGHLIWKALINLFTKIITAPFRALGALLGVEKDDLDAIEFERGRAALSPPEMEKLKNLSEALAKRPQIALKIQGRFDPSLDGEALRAMAVRLEIAKRAGTKFPNGEDPGPVDVDNPLVQQTIEAMVTERISGEVLAVAKEDAAKQAAEAVKDREKDGKKEEKKAEEKKKEKSLPPDLSRKLYSALLQKLVEVQPLSDQQLQDLSRERAEAIKRELTAAGTIDEARLMLLEPAASEAKAQERVPSKLTLDVRR